MAVAEMYMLLSQFRRQHFVEGSRPSLSTLRRLVVKGELPGRRFGGQWYIDYAAYISVGDSLISKVLHSQGGEHVPASP